MNFASLSLKENAAYTLKTSDFKFASVPADDAVFTVSNSALSFKLGSSTFAPGASLSFTWADLKAKKVSFIHDGSREAPSLSFVVKSGSGALIGQGSPTLKFSAVNAAPELELGDFLFKNASISEVTRDMLAATDRESADANLLFKISSVKGGKFLLSGLSSTSFSLGDVEAGLVSFQHSIGAVSFKVQALDSQKGASAVRSVTGAEDSSLDSVTLPSFAFKQLKLSEGQLLKLSSANLVLSSELSTLAKNDPLALEFSLGSSSKIEVLVGGLSKNSFTYDDVKKGKVALQHDGGEEAPELAFSLNGQPGAFSFAFSNIEDAPELEVRPLALNLGDSRVLDAALFSVSDDETPDSLRSAFLFSVKSSSGASFLKDGVIVKEFTLGDVEAGLVSLSRFAASATYSLSVKDAYGKSSALVSGSLVDNHAGTGSIAFSGSAKQGETLHAVSTLADADGLGPIEYSWLDAAGKSLGHGNSLLLTQDLVGKQIRLAAEFTDGRGSRESALSNLSAAVLDGNDAPTGSLNIGGTALQGQTLRALANFSDADGLGSLSYTWQDAAGNSLGQGAELTLTQALVGKQIRVEASYTDGGSFAEKVVSAFTESIANVNDAPTGSISIAGTPMQGQTLSASSSLIDADGLGLISYTWKDSSGNVLGNGPNLLLTQAHVGKQIRAEASYTDGQGTLESSVSAASSAVQNLNDAPTGSLLLSGLAQHGQSLSVSNNLADADGLGLISYTWKDASGSTLGSGSSLNLASVHVGNKSASSPATPTAKERKNPSFPPSAASSPPSLTAAPPAASCSPASPNRARASA